MKQPFLLVIIIFLLRTAAGASAAGPATDSIPRPDTALTDSILLQADTTVFEERLTVDEIRLGCHEHGEKLTLYDFPYSRTRSMPDWRRLWLNTGILMTAGVSTMLILEALPSDATAWNKTENAKIPLFKRWWQNVHKGPVWDGDNAVFNYILHPYAGAAYYMGARSNGFNMWGSFLYTFSISTFFWEYGFEAFNEIPSIQDLLITPVIGTILGEGFYVAKRHIVNNGYRLFGSKVAGYAAAFLLDPINELTGYFRGDQRKLTRRAEKRNGKAESGGLDMSTWIAPAHGGLQGGFSLTYTF